MKGRQHFAATVMAQWQTKFPNSQFPPIADWVHVDIRGWTLAERLDDAQIERLPSLHVSLLQSERGQVDGSQ